MLKIAIGTNEHWKQVKHLYPDYKFYHERRINLKHPIVADKILLLSSSSAKSVPLKCDNVKYIPEREYCKENPIELKVDGKKPRLTKVEFHLADHCNLNCNLCNHFCNLETMKTFPDIKVVEKDLKRLKELYWGIGTLCLVGGEPFLNPDFDKYCDMVREIFPDSDITVITNGILVGKENGKMFSKLSAMKRNEIKLLISKYPPTIGELNNIKKFVEKTGVDTSFTAEIKTFSKKLTDNGNNDRKKAYDSCHEKECHYLEKGKIYGCTVFGRIKKLNERFGTNYPDVGLDIYRYSDGWVLNSKLENQFPYCSYCASNYEDVPWSCGGEVELKNWMVENPKKITIKDKMIWLRDKIKKSFS